MLTHFETEVFVTPPRCHFLRREQPTFLYSLAPAPPTLVRLRHQSLSPPPQWKVSSATIWGNTVHLMAHCWLSHFISITWFWSNFLYQIRCKICHFATNNMKHPWKIGKKVQFILCDLNYKFLHLQLPTTNSTTTFHLWQPLKGIIRAFELK